MSQKYADDNLQYTDPFAYDRRKQRPIEMFVHSLWEPILSKYIQQEVKIGMTVCDLGCGTLEYTTQMVNAKKIFAVDINKNMLDFGAKKLGSLSSRTFIMNEDALHTSISVGSCDVVWSIGLSEFVSLDGLMKEIARISKPNGKLLIQFPNQNSPYNLVVSLIAKIIGRKIKDFRSLREMTKIASRYGFCLINYESTAVFLPVPRVLEQFFIPLWHLVTILFRPLEHFFPVGLNVFCVFQLTK